MNLIYRFCKDACFVACRLLYDAQSDGIDNIPNGGCLLAANHVSYLDPPLIGGLIRNNIYYLARKTLFKPPILHWLLPRVNVIPVDQQKPDMVGLKKIIHLLRSGEKVLLFPEGARSFDGQLQPPMPGIGFVVAKAQVPVVPVRVFGAYEAWPRTGKLKLFMPLRAVFGFPIQFSLPEKPSREDYEKVGHDIMSAIAQLKYPDFELENSIK
ncbi:MAG: lysophospholipid acyltransferase family protein [Verrucomicrobiota bacterium]